MNVQFHKNKVSCVNKDRLKTWKQKKQKTPQTIFLGNQTFSLNTPEAL